MKHATRSQTAIRSLCEGALMIGLATILSVLPLYRMPWGGSVDLAMLPIFLYCFKWGFGPGLLISVTHGVLQTLFEGGIAIGWESIIGDFLVAYTVLGFAGLFRRVKGGFYWGTLIGCGLRFLVHYVVGATIWAAYMPEEFFGLTMTTPWLYSALYNSVYMVIDCILVLFVGFLLMQTPVKKYLCTEQS